MFCKRRHDAIPPLPKVLLGTPLDSIWKVSNLPCHEDF